MANWASTSYRIEGKQEDLKTLNELINEFMDGKRPVMEDNASKDWEGNVALELGENTKGYYLRGFIQTCELEDDVLSIEAEEAWGATDFRHILEKHFEGMKVYFIVEEEGGEVYATNDKEGRFFDYRFLVDSCVNGAIFTEEDSISNSSQTKDWASLTQKMRRLPIFRADSTKRSSLHSLFTEIT